MSKIYNPNDLVLLNEYKAFEDRQKRFRFGYKKIRFSYEDSFPREEKIEWLNKYYERNGQTDLLRY